MLRFLLVSKNDFITSTTGGRLDRVDSRGRAGLDGRTDSRPEIRRRGAEETGTSRNSCSGRCFHFRRSGRASLSCGHRAGYEPLARSVRHRPEVGKLLQVLAATYFSK